MDLVSVVLSVLMIAVLIIIHEFGHFLAAKYYGFQTPIFGIGLPIGPGIDLFRKWETQFKFYFALIGGFVAIPELGDESDDEELKKYNLKPYKDFSPSKRAVVASAGIVFNILFAFLLACLMALSTGLPKAIPNTVISDFASKSSPAYKAGLQIGDKILAIDDHELQSASELQGLIKQSKDKEIQVFFERNSGDKSLEIKTVKIKSSGSLGIVLAYDKIYQKSANFFASIVDAFLFIVKTSLAMLFSIIALISALAHKTLGIFIPGLNQVSANLGEVKGIVGIVQLISHDIKDNAFLIFEFAILLSLNLAVINVLPIPGLDGGHLAFIAYEAISGKKISKNFQTSVSQLGIAFLLAIIAITTFNDLKNWIMP